MTRPAALLICACVTANLCSSGCAMMGGTNWLTGQRNDQSEPDVVEDKWAFVGKEGRGNRKMEKDDPIERFLWSDKAREINRNFGYE